MNLSIATLFWVDWKCPKKSDMKPDPSGPSGSTGWWQLKYFPFSIPLPWGFMIQFDLRIFFRRVGWNHQLSGNGLGWWFGARWFGFLGSPYESANSLRHGMPCRPKLAILRRPAKPKKQPKAENQRSGFSRLEVMSACGKFTMNKWTTLYASNCHQKYFYITV